MSLLKNMLIKFLPILLVWLLSVEVNAQDGSNHILYLKNGSIIRGTIVEVIPNKLVKIKTNDGSLFVFEIEQVLKVTKASDNASSMRHPEQKRNQMQSNGFNNPYTVHKKIASWGLASTMAATLVGSLAMNDDYFATTVIPIVGPFVTMVRIESDPNSSYLPGGKPLLIASGVAQTGFLIYFIASWAGENSYNAKFSVLPSSHSVGIEMRYYF
jgi:hypothetical protein